MKDTVYFIFLYVFHLDYRIIGQLPRAAFASSYKLNVLRKNWFRLQGMQLALNLIVPYA